MNTLTFEIDRMVLDRFPDAMVGGFLVEGLDRATKHLENTTTYIETARNTLLQQGLTIQNLANDPRIAAWRNAFSRMGLKPSTFKGSAEQLGRRLCRNETLATPLPSVNLYCALSARHLAPMGGYDLLKLQSQHVMLRFIRPEADSFTPLSGRPEDMPLSTGVVAYASGQEIICWGFNYRDSRNTCLDHHTRSAVFFSEGVTTDHHQPLADALAELRETLLSKEAQVSDLNFVSHENPQAVLALPGL